MGAACLVPRKAVLIKSVLTKGIACGTACMSSFYLQMHC